MTMLRWKTYLDPGGRPVRFESCVARHFGHLMRRHRPPLAASLRLNGCQQAWTLLQLTTVSRLPLF